MGDLIRVRTAMSVKLLASLAFCCLCISAEKTLACSDGYLEFEGACYGLMEGLDSVEEYSLTCEALGGALVSIHSAEENDFVLSLVPPNKSGDGYTAWTWTSGKCPGMECEWGDGSSWDFDMFKEGQPNAGGYVVIGADGWSDVGFDNWGNTNAICKIN